MMPPTRSLELHYNLVVNVAEYFERERDKWKKVLASGGHLVQLPRWIEIYKTFPEHIKHWRNESDRLHLELYGKKPDF